VSDGLQQSFYVFFKSFYDTFWVNFYTLCESGSISLLVAVQLFQLVFPQLNHLDTFVESPPATCLFLNPLFYLADLLPFSLAVSQPFLFYFSLQCWDRTQCFSHMKHELSY
jgi:hypothetical protein